MLLKRFQSHEYSGIKWTSYRYTSCPRYYAVVAVGYKFYQSTTVVKLLKA